jgi:histidyl-tRNA synthetase
MSEEIPVAERPVGLVRGTQDWLPSDCSRLAEIEAALIDRFGRSGYVPMRIPILEHTELHERKSGAGIVSKLYELADGHQTRVCLRPELTAGIVRAYAEAAEAPVLPWRVCVSGSVFRHEAMRPGFDREFHQVGVEMLGAAGPSADGEVIWLAWWSLRELGISNASIRIGHVGLILELFERSGLPKAACAALVERLSEAASEGRDVAALETALAQLADWLGTEEDAELTSLASSEDAPGVDRLFRTLVPDVTGRRSGREIVARLRRKWDLSHSLNEVLVRLKGQIHDLAALRGPASSVLSQLEFVYESFAPESVASLRSLIATLDDYGVDMSRLELDLGFGRGIGFYSQMVFELVAHTPNGLVEVCGGGRYDGLARVLGSDRDDRGVGFAFGMERLLEALRASGESHEGTDADSACVLAESPGSARDAIRLATSLRSQGLRILVETERTQDQWVRQSLRQVGRLVVVRGEPSEPGSLLYRDLWNETEARVVTIDELPQLLRGETRLGTQPQ